MSPSATGNIDSDLINDEKAIGHHDVGSELDPAEQARLLRKIDWNVLPVVILLYIWSLLDSVNLGNAEVAGLSTDLRLVGFMFNTVASLFYIPFILAEVPSNILLKLFRPSRWLPANTFARGLIVTLMCLVNTYHGLLVARILLGLTEGGLIPGVNYYLSMWYPRAHVGKRIAITFSGATLAGAFSGLLAYAITKMDGIGGLHGWQWIFCVEGLVTVTIAFGAFIFLQDYPETASFLTEAERRNIIGLLKNDSQNLATHYSFQFVLQALKDYKVYIVSCINVCVFIPVASIGLFLPKIIHELGFSAVHSQLLSVPPYVMGFVSSILAGTYSDKKNIRGPYVIGGAFVSLSGYIMLYTQEHIAVSYAGAVLAVAGTAAALPLCITWASSNAGGDMKRGVVIAMVVAFASLGGCCASFIYFDPPRYHAGHGINICCLSVVIFGSAFSMWNYNRVNKRKEKECNEGGITEERRDEFRNMGDQSPLFRYTL